MKTLLLSAAAALALTAPVFADTAEIAARHFAQSAEGGDGARYSGPTSAGNPGETIAHFAQSRSGGDGPRLLIPSDADGVMSTSNSDLASFAAQHLHNDERGDN